MRRPWCQTQFAELTKLYVETKDNVKFLTTLERHFKNITHYKSIAHGSLSTIADTLAGPHGIHESTFQ